MSEVHIWVRLLPTSNSKQLPKTSSIPECSSISHLANLAFSGKFCLAVSFDDCSLWCLWCLTGYTRFSSLTDWILKNYLDLNVYTCLLSLSKSLIIVCNLPTWSTFVFLIYLPQSWVIGFTDITYKYLIRVSEHICMISTSCHIIALNANVTIIVSHSNVQQCRVCKIINISNLVCSK